MDSKQTYETCAAIADALPTRPRAEFAAMVHRYTIGASPVPNRYRRIVAALDGHTTRGMMPALVSVLRTRNEAAAAAARRWLRDGGWL